MIHIEEVSAADRAGYKMGLKRLYLLTETAERFFANRGYMPFRSNHESQANHVEESHEGFPA